MAQGGKDSGKDKSPTHKKEANEGETKNIIYTLAPPVNLPQPAENYAVLNLDGSPDDVRRSWTKTILQFRLWCYNNSDERFEFGMPARSSCVLPSSGNFLVYMHYASKWLCAVIDGPSGYLDGYILISTGNQKDIRAKENRVRRKDAKSNKQSKAQARPVYISMAGLLPWRGNYVNADECRVGYYAFIPSFKDIYQCVAGPDLQTLELRDKAVVAGQTLIIHLPEAARSDDLFQYIYNNFDGHDLLGSERLIAVRRWKKDCKAARLVMRGVFPNRHALFPPKQRPYLKHKSKITCVQSNSNKEGKSTARTDEHSIIENIRLFQRPCHTHGMFYLDKMPVHLVKDGPINKQWAEDKLLESSNYDSKVSFLIKRMPNFPSSNIVKGGGEGFTAKREGGGSVENYTAPAGFKHVKDHTSSKGTTDKIVKYVKKRTPSPDGIVKPMENGVSSSLQDGCPSARPSASVPARSAPHPVSVPMLEQTYFAVKKAVLSKGKIAIATPVGLHNLGNTCYMNSTIQCLRAVPELKSILMRYSDGKGKNIDKKAHDLTIEARNLLRDLIQTDNSVKPEKFLKMLRAKRRQFQQKEGNSYMQQDAEEFWTEMLATFSETILSEENEPSSGKIKELFGIDFVRRSHCPETGEEDSDTESLYFLKCYMPTDDIKHLHQGIKHGLTSERMKLSPKLGQEVTYLEDLKISVLPRYLTLHFCRYDWDTISNQAFKILRKVDFPAVLNVYEYCSDELQQKINVAKKRLPTSGGESSNANTDKVNSSVVTNEVTGVYDLVAVLTHQGQTVNSGHYIAWVEQENGSWVEFNDEKTSLHQLEDVLRLSGGGDKQMAFICLYKARVI